MSGNSTATAELKSGRKLGNRFNTKQWPLLSLLDSDFLLQIRMILMIRSSCTGLHDAALIVTKDKMVYSLGNNEYGQLGIDLPRDQSKIHYPMKVNSLCQKNIKTFKVAFDNSIFALTEEGNVYAWGKISNIWKHGIQAKNTDSIISQGVERQSAIIALLAGIRIVDINYSHDYILALADDGKMYGCKDISLLSSNSFTRITSEELETKKVKSITSGETFNIAITEDGALYSWGMNRYGQLGLGMNNSICVTPTRITMLNDVFITKVQCGNAHTIALSDQGQVYVWGYNFYGQLGTGDTENVYYPVLLNALENIVDISAQQKNSISVAMNQTKHIYVWGNYMFNTLLPTATAFDTMDEVFWNIGHVTIHPCSSNRQFDNNILQRLSEAFDNCTTSTFIMKVEGQFIHVHKDYLSIRCPRFVEQYAETGKEDELNTVIICELKDFSYEAYRAFLKYLYTDVIDKCSEGIFELLQLADLYNERTLMKDCIQLLKAEIAISNVTLYYSLAIKHKVKELEKFCFRYAVSNMTAVIQSKGFSEMNEIFRLALITEAAKANAFKN